MNRISEELLVIKLNLAAAKLLECYQWNHLALNYAEINERLAAVQLMLEDLQQRLLEVDNTE